MIGKKLQVNTRNRGYSKQIFGVVLSPTSFAPPQKETTMK